MATANSKGETAAGDSLSTIMWRVLGPEKDFMILTAVYGAGISLLSLALPISVQMLINTVANTGLIAPLVVLAVTLFVLLLVSGLLNALRVHLMEVYGRRFYARLVSEVALRTIYAQNPFFTDQGLSPLFNRYFDVVIVQKTIPYLLIGGFTIILQAVVGFTLVSLYHPLFLVFNLVFILLIWAGWNLWGESAIRTGIELSHRKHATAAWLESLGASNGFFKSDRLIAHAIAETDAATGAYVDQHRRHFRRHFAQTIALMVIYAAASASLLGLGGWLVIEGQLTLGQLVAAELILSAAFAGVAQLGGYLTSFYDLCASVEELSLFSNIEQEAIEDASTRKVADATLRFEKVSGDARREMATLDFSIPAGLTVMAEASSHGVQRLFTNLLKRHESPQGGILSFGGEDILAIDVHSLRRQVLVVDRPNTVALSLRDNLSLSCDDARPGEVLEILGVVGLEDVIARLDAGLDTKLAASGFPLSITELIEFKIAAALLSKPKVLILNQLGDLVPEATMRRILQHARAVEGMTFIYFTNRGRDLGFDAYLRLGENEQTLFRDYAAFNRARGSEEAFTRKRIDPQAVY